MGELLHELPDRGEAWTVLGFDVCDRVGCSGLMNCGLQETAEEARGARAWASHLNEHHLFTRWETADAFRQYVDVEVREHAPFLVYELYSYSTSTSLAGPAEYPQGLR
jgi:hypothetical protein